MGGGGSESTTQSSNSQVNMIPQWVQNAGQQNYALAQNIAQRPLQQYQGQMVAGVSPQTQQAWNLAASSGNVGADQFNAATAGNLNAIGQTPMSINPAQLANTSLNPYLSPYTQNVIDKTLPIMQQNLALSQNQQGNAASSAGAFGGSRQGVQQGVTQAQGALGMGQMAAQLNQANFQQAQQAAQSDVAAQNLAAFQNQSAQQAKINSDIQASAGLANVGTSLGRQNAANYAMLSSAGAGQQQQQQNDINANMAKFNQAWNYPATGLGMMESTLSNTPYNTASAGESTSTTKSQDSPNFASMALGGLQTLGGLFSPAAPTSDKRIKKNIVSLGKDPITGVPVKSFNFKGQSPGSPKTIGPLAQDIEKRAPGSTFKVGGIMAVPRETLAAATPSVAHLPSHAANKTIADFMPPSSPGIGPLAASSPGVAKGISAMSAATAMPRAGARGVRGALANTKARPRVMGGLGV